MSSRISNFEYKHACRLFQFVNAIIVHAFVRKKTNTVACFGKAITVFENHLLSEKVEHFDELLVYMTYKTEQLIKGMKITCTRLHKHISCTNTRGL